MAKEEYNAKRRARKRFTIIASVLVAVFAAVGIRLFWIVIFDGERYAQAALSQIETESSSVSAKRGDILDTNGVTLATSTVVYNLILDPEVILSGEDNKYLTPTLSLISKHFSLDIDELTQKVYDNPESNYIVLLKQLTYSEVQAFIEEKNDTDNIAGVWLEQSYKRNYTFGTLASSVLGFARDGDGIYGLEYQYNDVLKGTDGREYSYVNSDNVVETVTRSAEDGQSIVTTIDYNIQSIVEEKIAEYIATDPDSTVAVIAQDPNTGAILAMADSGQYDCNNPYDLSVAYTQEEIDAMSEEDSINALSSLWTNFCVTSGFEPGSVFKPFTMAAGFEENAISLDDTWYCSGSATYLNYDISCHVTTGHGELSTMFALANSCNVALMGMSERIGVSDFCAYQTVFGFGEYTDIDLPNETSCEYLLYREDTMGLLDLVTNSFGQNFNVTMIQLSTAFCSLVNGGYYYKPYVVKSICDSDGNVVQSNSATLVSQTVSKGTSDTIKKCLRSVVTNGTGSATAVKGYVVSGKTGTAEKSTLGKEKGVYTVSFIGFAPYENPEVVLYVLIDEPEVYTGVAASLFYNIMSEILPYMNVTGFEDDYDPAVEWGGTDINYEPETQEEQTEAQTEAQTEPETSAPEEQTQESAQEQSTEEIQTDAFETQEETSGEETLSEEEQTAEETEAQEGGEGGQSETSDAEGGEQTEPLSEETAGEENGEEENDSGNAEQP